MLVFIVPLRNRATCRDWDRISNLCERSLRSMCQQTSSEFRVIVVCKEAPAMEFTHPALTIIQEDFAEPDEAFDARERDKWLKLKRGLIAARSLAPAHILFADADDCVNRDLAAVSAEQPDAHGWYFPVGYMHEEGSRWIYRRSDFQLTCGTSAMIRCEPADLPQGMDAHPGDYFMLCKGHPIIREFMAERGTPLQPLPFIGSVYVTGTGENHSGIAMSAWHGKKMLLKKLIHSRPLMPWIRARYGLYKL